MNQSKYTQLIVIGLVACSMLLHEILLTRICALRLQFHFAFLVISNCLLGLGAAGTVLSLRDASFRRDHERWLQRLCLANFLALTLTYCALVRFPLPGEVSTSKPLHLLGLSAFNLIGAVPFFFSGLIIGLLLTMNAERVNRFYAVDLFAAGLGCLACPLLLPLVGAGGAFATSALLAFVAYGVMRWQHSAPAARVAMAAIAAVIACAIPRLDSWVPVPTKSLPEAPAKFTTQSTWTSNSRIDLMTSDGCAWPLFMRGKNASVPPPRECAEIAQDATAATTISNFTQEPQALQMLRTSMYATAYRLRPGARVLVIGLGGGNDAWAAKAFGARSIRAIELNWPIVAIHKHALRRFSRWLVEDPNVEIVVDEGRSALMRDNATYGVVQMTGIDTWTALASGAYVLAENYLYTREALASMYQRLEPDGIMQISRFSMAMETMRLISSMDAALSSLGIQNIDASLIALSTPDNMTAVLLKKGTFTAEEQLSTVEFARQNGMEVVYLPSQPRMGYIDWFTRSPTKQEIIDWSPFNISPVDDDRPYFFNFYRWKNLLRSLDQLETPTIIAQGNPGFILIQLAISVLLSVLLIVAPLLRSQGVPQRSARPFLLYFSGLGAGFISIELAIIQKLNLFLGQPVYSLTVTLFALLIFTGLGSLLFAHRFDIASKRVLWIPIGIAAYSSLINVGVAGVVTAFIGATLPGRIAVTLVLLAPLGLLLGVPFAYGLRVAAQVDPRIVPWAWAVNGCLSVVGSIMTVIISMNFGFSMVLWLGSLIYVVAFVALYRSRAKVAVSEQMDAAPSLQRTS